MLYQQTLLAIQVLLSVLLILGVQTKAASIGSWILYLSLTLRNTWLAFILDRYFHYLLFYSMFLPLDGTWTVYDVVVYGGRRKKTKTTNTTTKNEGSSTNTTAATANTKAAAATTTTFVTPATIAFKLFITWLYFDAGYGKYTDPMAGWTYGAQPLPALDTYVRHTLMARYLYGLLGPSGLRLLTPTVVYVELLGVPIALVSSFCRARRALYCAIGLMCSMHIGIALTMTNTVLLSSVACVAWCLFLPEGVGRDIHDLISWSSSSLSNVDENNVDSSNSISKQNTSSTSVSSSLTLIIKQHGISTIILLTFIGGSIWFETMSTQCNQSMEYIWSSLLHNRWNVFIGAEEYVTWEIAPGRLLDGSIVDIWSKSDAGVSWDMPGTTTAGSGYYNTARRGRWRSFPYLAGLDGEDGDALWSYLCREWDKEHNVNEAGRRGKRLLKYNFFMLQADVLPNMGFSATRKRLIHQHDCLADTNFATKDTNITR